MTVVPFEQDTCYVNIHKNYSVMWTPYLLCKHTQGL